MISNEKNARLKKNMVRQQPEKLKMAYEKGLYSKMATFFVFSVKILGL